MDLKETIEILQSLALGIDPESGESLAENSVLHHKKVHSALLIALYSLETELTKAEGELIPEDEIEKALEALATGDYSGSPNQLTGFFLGNRAFNKGNPTSHDLYGRYDSVYSKGQLLDFFMERKEKVKLADEPWREVSFFEEPKFNRLSERALEQLRERVDAIPIQRTDLPNYMLRIREKYPRAYEPWIQDEVYLFSNALKYTNDVEVLAECFGRSNNSVKSFGKRFLYENPDFLLKE